MSFFEEYVSGSEEFVKAQRESDDDLHQGAVQMAFVEPGLAPLDPDFSAAAWVLDEPGVSNRSRILLDAGTYELGFYVVWGKLVDSPETVIRPFGMIRIV